MKPRLLDLFCGAGGSQVLPIPSTPTEARFWANDSLEIVGGGGLDRWGFFLAFVLFAGIVIIRLYRLDEQIDELRGKVRVTAEIGSYSGNVPDPGPDKASIKVRVLWEIWVAEDTTTDRLALNVIYVYDRRWWQLWRRTRFPITGLPGKKNNTTRYREFMYASSPQPFRDDDEFEYVTERDEEGDPHWLLELVLVTGSPRNNTYRVPLALPTPEELRARGTNPPL